LVVRKYVFKRRRDEKERSAGAVATGSTYISCRSFPESEKNVAIRSTCKSARNYFHFHNHRRTRRGSGERPPPLSLKNFRESASCSKILNNKKYIFSTVNSRHPMFFRARVSCKTPECKQYIQYSEKFQGDCFSGQALVAQKS